MRILYLLQEIPYPLTSGALVKVYNIISHMAAHHECDLLCFGDDDASDKASALERKIPGIRILELFEKKRGMRLQVERLRAVCAGKPVFLPRWQTRKFKTALNRVLSENDYDVIHLDALAMAPYIVQLNNKVAVISITDAVSRCYQQQARATQSFFKRVYRKYESRTIARFEKDILPQFTRVHVVSRDDRQYLQNLHGGIRAEYIEHGVPDSVLGFKPSSEDGEMTGPCLLLPGGLINTAAVATGVINFLSIVYPILRNDYPNLTVKILGRYPSKRLLRLMSETPGVQYVDWVDDYYAEHSRADIVVLTDVSGSGIKTRFLYALGLGCPVVASPAASAGLEITDGIHFFRREMDHSFAEAIAKLLQDRAARQKLGTNARQLMMETFSKTELGRRWEALYTKAIEEG